MISSGRTAVVVSSHRMYSTLELCLRGFQAIVPQPEDLIFVDNGSPEKLGSWAAKRFPGITIVSLEQNCLFCGGYNAGMRVALERGYEFVLIVNADTEVINPGFINELLATARRWPQAAFIGPLVYLRSIEVVQNTCLRFPSVLRSVLTWLPWRFAPANFSRQPPGETEVEFLNGVCVLCRADALREIGLMDETFGGYVEDADWSWRAKKKGWISVFAPVTSIIHHEEISGYEHYSYKVFLLKRNTVIWFLKVGRRNSARFYAICALGLSWLRSILTNNREERKRLRGFTRNLAKIYSDLLGGGKLGR